MTPARHLRFALLAAMTPALAQMSSLGPAPWLDPSQPRIEAPASGAKAGVKSATIIGPIATGSRQASRAAYNAYFAPPMPAMGYTGSVAGCAPGAISSAFKDFTISRVNYYRAMAGLPGNVSVDVTPAFELQEQSAATVYSADTVLSHSVTSSSCTALVTAANSGGTRSNIALGCGSSQYDDVIPRYIDDSGTGNEVMGHRRWILFPPQASMTVGSTPTGACAPKSWGANALRVFDGWGSRPPTPNGVAWPPAGFVPMQVLPPSNRWTYSYNGASFAGATVSITANGTPVGATVISSTDNGYGDNTIAFVPGASIAAGTNYTVTVSGISGGGAPSSYSYTVRPFNATAVIPGVNGDFNGNGMSDLLLAHGDGRAVVWLMNGGAIAAQQEIIGPGSGFTVKHLADFEGNGRSDIVWQHTDGRVVLWTMNGTTVTGGATILAANAVWTPSHTGDFNGDGKADLLWRHADGSAAVWLMDGATRTGGAGILGPGSGFTATKVADFNADGRDDILWTHADGRVAIWLMNGSTMAGGGTILGAGTGWSAIQVGDFNGDGKADIIWRHTDGRVALWLMDGARVIGGGAIFGAGTSWTVARVADFNGDGRSDLLWTHADGRASIWLMNGATASAQAQVLNAGSGWTPKRTADLNGDGKADILWQHTDGRLTSWLMDGTANIGGGGLLGPGTGWSVTAVSQ